MVVVFIYPDNNHMARNEPGVTGVVPKEVRVLPDAVFS
jgi:hypothetical protein